MRQRELLGPIFAPRGHCLRHTVGRPPQMVRLRVPPEDKGQANFGPTYLGLIVATPERTRVWEDCLPTYAFPGKQKPMGRMATRHGS